MDNNGKGKNPVVCAPTAPLSPRHGDVTYRGGNDDSYDCLLHEQRREIAAAKALNTDIDVAYNLQMEEAITASLSAFNTDSHSQEENDTVVYIPENHADFDYTAFLLEDVERLDQERRDREASERLMMEMRGDLDRLIHDQKLASEILNIPDSQWEKDGDNYHNPYRGLGCSSSSSSLSGELVLVNNENFKVYCKGLVSEETIKDNKVIVCGIGVAICDSKDNLILEVRKALDFGCNEQEVKIQALIKGLNRALMLDFKKITLFCDDNKVFQYVTGTVQPTENRIVALVNEVTVLQRNFAECRLFFVGCNGMKLAYKLARHAIVSQLNWPVESGKGKRCLKETCAICFDDTDVGRMFSVDGCLHRYCFSCMKKHVEVKLLNGLEKAKCPHEGCDSEVSVSKCREFLGPKLVEMFIQKKKEASIAVTEKVYCPYMRCSALMSKSEVLEYTKGFFLGAEESGARKCKQCYNFFCINCKVPWHYNMTCYDYKACNPHPHKEDAMLDSLAKKKLWRECVNCKNMVELAEGCYHITCRCGYEFCYTCGAPWKNKKATCTCRIWDEHNIIRDGLRR